MNLLGSGVVAGVVARVDVDDLVGDAGPAQGGLAGPGDGGGQAEDPHDRGAQDRCLGGGPAATDRVGCPAPLPVGGTCQGHGHLCAGDGLGDLDRVADGPDVGVGGALVAVDPDGPARTEVQARLERQRARGSHAYIDDDKVGSQGGAVGQGDGNGAGQAGYGRLTDDATSGGQDRVAGRDGLGGHAEAQVDPVCGELVGQQRCEFGVQWWQDVVGEFDEVDLQTASRQGFDRLQADEPRTDDDCARPWLALAARGEQAFDAFSQGVDIGDGAQAVDGRVVQSVDGRTHACGARGQH